MKGASVLIVLVAVLFCFSPPVHGKDYPVKVLFPGDFAAGRGQATFTYFKYRGLE